MTKAEIKEARQIQAQINRVSDQILENLGEQTGGDVYVAIAALTVALCALARADEMPLTKVVEALGIAHRQVNMDH
jgi:replication-associated recombination protein RarA